MRYKSPLIFAVLAACAVLTVPAGGAGEAGPAANAEKNGPVMLKNIPYICQTGRLDCHFTSLAMLIGGFSDNYDTLFYPELIYRSALGFGFVYYPRKLRIPYTIGTDKDYRWLASVYGLAYKPVAIKNTDDAQGAWEEYLRTIREFLLQGSAVQTWRAWGPYREEAGKLYTDAGIRPFWWEGVEKKNRPQQHAIVVVGLDLSKGVVYLNDPGCGWFGMSRAEEMKLDEFRKVVEMLSPAVRYRLRAYTKNGETPEKAALEGMLQKRIEKKIAGVPEVYYAPEMGEFGLPGLKSFSDDLEPDAFSGILRGLVRKGDSGPPDILTELNLGIYQYCYLTSITADYLESARRIKEWESMSRLNIMYRRLYVLSTELAEAFKAEPDLNQAMVPAGPILKEMRAVLAGMEVLRLGDSRPAAPARDQVAAGRPAAQTRNTAVE